jgi:hypothetical protein
MAVGIGEMTDLIDDEVIRVRCSTIRPCRPLRVSVSSRLNEVDDIDDIVEATAGTIADTASRDSDGQMDLAGAGCHRRGSDSPYWDILVPSISPLGRLRWRPLFGSCSSSTKPSAGGHVISTDAKGWTSGVLH